MIGKLGRAILIWSTGQPPKSEGGWLLYNDEDGLVLFPTPVLVGWAMDIGLFLDLYAVV